MPPDDGSRIRIDDFESVRGCGLPFPDILVGRELAHDEPGDAFGVDEIIHFLDVFARVSEVLKVTKAGCFNREVLTEAKRLYGIRCEYESALKTLEWFLQDAQSMKRNLERFLQHLRKLEEMANFKDLTKDVSAGMIKELEDFFSDFHQSTGSSNDVKFESHPVNSINDFDSFLDGCRVDATTTRANEKAWRMRGILPDMMDIRRVALENSICKDIFLS